MTVYAWQNADGLTAKNPDYYKNPANFVNVPHALVTFGAKKQVVVDVDLTRIPTATTSYTSDLNNDGTLDGFNTGDTYLPAYASVTAVELYTVVAATGGTSFTIGTYGLTGSAVSATSLATATECVTANFDTIGKRTFGAGALVSTSVGTASVGAADAYIGITTSGTFTAGKIRLIITYVEPLADS